MTAYDPKKAKDNFLMEMACGFDNKSVCNVTVHVAGRDIMCLKFALCQHSAWFRQALDDPFEANEIILSNDDPDAMYSLLQFCHRFGYSVRKLVPHTHLQHHIRVFALAERYQIPDLQRLARDKIANALASKSKKHPNLGVAIRLAYSETCDLSDLLRPVFVNHVLKNPSLLADGTSDSVDGLIDVLKEVPLFAFDVARALAAEKLEMQQCELMEMQKKKDNKRLEGLEGTS